MTENSPPTKTLLAKAVALHRQGRLAEARAGYLQVLELQQNHAGALQLLGVVASQEGDYLSALDCLDRAVSLQPDFTDAWSNRGIALHNLERFEDALQSYDRALTLNRDFAEAFNNRGLTLAALDRPNEALLDYDRAIHLRADYVEAHINRGDALSTLHREPEATTSYAKAHLCKGNALSAAGRVEEALASYQRAIDFSPNYPETHHAVGLVMAYQGELELSLSAVRRALELRLRNPDSSILPAGRNHPGANQADNEKLLWRTLATLFAADFHAFPCSGTLLGLIRDGHLLSFDKDVDIGIPIEELQAVVKFLQERGWKERPEPMRLLNKRVMVHPDSDLVWDFTGFAVEKDTGQVIGGFWQQGLRKEWQRITEHPPIQLRQITRDEGPVWMLRDSPAWLAATYGDWRIVDPAWDSVVAAKNLRGFSMLTRCYGFLRIWSYWHLGQANKALSVTRNCLQYMPGDDLLVELAAHFTTC